MARQSSSGEVLRLCHSGSSQWSRMLYKKIKIRMEGIRRQKRRAYVTGRSFRNRMLKQIRGEVSNERLENPPKCEQV